ncbi:MAG: LysE family translocator [Candidatus Thioglobus sp.]|jgi:threonine/homoserine/homoserine lactone efflux protein|nr:LysE family translocator [Candidatus Pseudothioglobus singularis]MDP0595227.1 LysE family translocator [Candidatus Thioglobus sp.]
MIATFVYAISPGPGLFAVLAISTRFGPIPAIWVSIGHTVGDIIYVALAMLALNALAEVINESMLYVKILGASYLIFIGYQQFRSKGISFEPSSKKSSVIKLLIAGFVVGVTNPKTIIFYLSFLPIFIDLNNLTLNTEVQVIVAIGLTVFFVLSLANILGVRLRSYIENPDSIRRINQVTGVTMILVGVFVALY